MAKTTLKQKLNARLKLMLAEERVLTPKQHVQLADSAAMLDYYELLRGAGRPCWFIRSGIQGPPYTPICATPKAAWKSAYKGLLDALRKAAA